jgi:hypothetical protein
MFFDNDNFWFSNQTAALVVDKIFSQKAASLKLAGLTKAQYVTPQWQVRVFPVKS